MTKEVTMKNRLETIATRQRKSIVRDALFVVAVAAAAIIGVSSVATAANVAGSSVVHVAQR